MVEPKTGYETKAVKPAPAATGGPTDFSVPVKPEGTREPPPVEQDSIDADDADALDAVMDDADGVPFVVAPKEIVETFYPKGCLRPSHVILYHKGQVVPKAALAERSAAIRLAKDAKSDDPKARVAATIDATTLASGTWPGIDALPKEKAK